MILINSNTAIVHTNQARTHYSTSLNYCNTKCVKTWKNKLDKSILWQWWCTSVIGLLKFRGSILRTRVNSESKDNSVRKNRENWRGNFWNVIKYKKLMGRRVCEKLREKGPSFSKMKPGFASRQCPRCSCNESFWLEKNSCVAPPYLFTGSGSVWLFPVSKIKFSPESKNIWRHCKHQGNCHEALWEF